MPLTPTQQAVVRLLALGKTPKAISAELGMSPKTVNVHKFHACKRMQWRNLIDLHHGAMTAGWIGVEDLK